MSSIDTLKNLAEKVNGEIIAINFLANCFIVLEYEYFGVYMYDIQEKNIENVRLILYFRSKTDALDLFTILGRD